MVENRSDNVSHGVSRNCFPDVRYLNGSRDVWAIQGEHGRSFGKQPRALVGTQGFNRLIYGLLHQQHLSTVNDGHDHRNDQGRQRPVWFFLIRHLVGILLVICGCFGGMRLGSWGFWRFHGRSIIRALFLVLLVASAAQLVRSLISLELVS